MPWVDPVWDRTPADVAFAANNRDSPEPLKGARNASDLQRVTGNIHYLAESLNQYGYSLTPLCKTDWALNEVPPEAELAKIKSDLAQLKGLFGYVDMPDTPDLPYTSYQKMNDIEKMIFDTQAIITLLKQSFRRCGTFAAGEDFNFTQTGGA